MSDFSVNHPHFFITKPEFHIKIEIYRGENSEEKSSTTKIAHQSMKFPKESTALTNVEDINSQSSRQKELSSGNFSQLIDEVKDHLQLPMKEQQDKEIKETQKMLQELKSQLQFKDQQIALLQMKSEFLHRQNMLLSKL